MNRESRPALLALHTTEPEASVALGLAGDIQARSLPSGGAHAQALMPILLDLVSTAGTSLTALDGVVVSTGPGSFTGIRVGIATAQGLAAARAWSIHRIDSLSARAAACTGAAEPLAVVLDARRGEVYAALYNVERMPPRVLVAPFCASPADAAARLATGGADAPAGAGGRAPLVVTGSGAALVLPVLPWARPFDGPVRPVASALVELAWCGACALEAPHAVEPTYLRKSDAEVRRDRVDPPPA